MPRHPAKPSRLWPRLTARLAEARRRRGETEAAQPTDTLPLKELRRSRGVSQVSLAHAMGTSQPGVSKIEGQADLQVGTLRKYLEGLGARLELIARFPNGAVRLDRFPVHPR